MRLAILADIHGNLAAFQAALDHIARQHIDQIIIAGDIVVGAPDSAACWQLAKSLNCAIIRGNHERYVATLDQPNVPALMQSEQYGPVRWAHQQLSPAERAELAALPLHLRPEGCPELLIVHSSLRNDRDHIVAYTPEAVIAEAFPNIREHTIVRGHNHVAAVRLWGQRTIVTTGAAGLPLDLSTTAQYLILEQTRSGWDIQHQSVPYDVAQTVRRFETSGCLAATGPIGLLFQREVATASGQIVPFLEAYERWQQHEPMSLRDAVQRFLTSVG